MILSKETQKDCVCSHKADKQTILLKKKRAGDTGTSLLTSHLIVFVLEGAVKYTIAGSTVTVHRDEFFFLPSSTNVVWEALEETTVLMFRLNDLIGKISECHTFRFQRLSGNPPENRGIYLLRANEQMRGFMGDVEATERDGLRCGNYALHLVAILLARIQFYYPQEEYMRFYSTVASPDVRFSDMVYERWMECRTVCELAGALNMTVRRFTQHFHKAFGESPGSWLKKRRKENVYRDICSSHLALCEIAIKHGVSLTNLVRYCRTNYGDTPSRIRASLVNSKIA